MKKTVLFSMAVLVILSMVLSACGTPTPAAPPTAKPVVPPTEAPVVPVPTEPAQPPVVPPAEPVSDERVEVTWYIGLGSGGNADQIPQDKAFVEKFNKSQDKIRLTAVIIDNRYARDNLIAQLAAGNAPDIVGPVGTEGRAAFPGQFLDLQPLIDKSKYDTGGIDPAFMDFYKVEGQLVGLPFAIFPSAVFVNKTLFEEAGLALPPQKVGEKYKWADGTEEEWNFDTLAKVARKLTVDKAGKDATQPGFDAKNIAQWGFQFQWNGEPRAFGSYFCAYYPVKDGKADIPACWIAAWKWYYDAMWGKQPFAPTSAAVNSDLMKGNEFSSGKVAMAETHLWYTCCIDKKNVPSWDVAIAPSYDGKITAKMHGDTFAIMSQSKNPEAAWTVYQYMLTTGSADLYKAFGGLPARQSQQADFLKSLDETFAPNKVNWQVFLDMIPYLDAPNHQLGLGPNNAKAADAFNKLGSDFSSNDKLDVDARVATFIEELNAILSPAATPTP